MYVFFLREKIKYALCCIPNNVQEMAPKQTIIHGRKGKGTENS